MKYLLTIFISIILLNIGYSQSIEMQVISSTGSTNSNGKLEYTLGEAIIAGNSTLTQGFHQGRLNVTAIEETINNIEVIAYPNPTMDGINIKTSDLQKVDIRLFDYQGKHISSTSIDHFPYYLDLKRFDSGIYYIQLYDKNQILKTFKIEKIK